MDSYSLLFSHVVEISRHYHLLIPKNTDVMAQDTYYVNTDSDFCAPKEKITSTEKGPVKDVI